MLTLSVTTSSTNKRNVSNNDLVSVVEDIESYATSIDDVANLIGSKFVTNRFVISKKDLEIEENKCFVVNQDLSFKEDYKIVLNDNSNIKFLNMNI